MTTLKGYNPVTLQWEPVSTGVPGPPGTKGDDGDMGPPGIPIVPVAPGDWPPADPQPDTLYLRLAL